MDKAFKGWLIIGHLKALVKDFLFARTRGAKEGLGKPINRDHLRVVGWLGRASPNHFQRASNQKVAGKPFKNKGKLRKSQGKKRPSNQKMVGRTLFQPLLRGPLL